MPIYVWTCDIFFISTESTHPTGKSEHYSNTTFSMLSFIYSCTNSSKPIIDCTLWTNCLLTLHYCFTNRKYAFFFLFVCWEININWNVPLWQKINYQFLLSQPIPITSFFLLSISRLVFLPKGQNILQKQKDSK